MRALNKGNIAIFKPQGFLDGTNAPTFMTIEDIQATEKLKVDMILVSLEKVIFFNKNGLDIFAKLLVSLRNKMHITVGFCDYDATKFDTIMKFYHNDINFSLFKTAEIAALFCGTNQSKPKDVLLFNEDASQRSSMAIELFDFGHNPIVAQSQKEFDEKRENKDLYYAIIEDSFLGLFGSKIGTRVTGNAVIYSLNNYLDAEISSKFNPMYHTNSLMVGFRLFIFDAYKVVSMNIHALNFFARLASSAAEYNANICFVGMTFDKTPEAFKNELEDSGILFFEHMDDILLDKEMLETLGASSAAMVKQKRPMNKVIISELPRFINATVTTMEMMTNSKAVKDTVVMQSLVSENAQKSYASSIGFYGDMDGMLVLVFPKDIAKKSCELLLGESTDDEEEILDALAEFVNIIGGRVKTLLSEQKISVDITLPRTYQKVSDLLEVMQGKKGVQVNLKFDQDEFIFFLTR